MDAPPKLVEPSQIDRTVHPSGNLGMYENSYYHEVQEHASGAVT